MGVDPLAVVQARIGSTRLPGKMLLDLGGKPLIWWAWSAAVEAFEGENVVTAIPASAENDELAATVEGFGGQVFRWGGPENDVLGRFYHCAHRYRWHPDSVIVRVTPDDPFKDPHAMRRVVEGERLPVEIGAEAFTLGDLNFWQHGLVDGAPLREHLTTALFLTPPPPPPPGVWTIDTQEDLDMARALVDEE